METELLVIDRDFPVELLLYIDQNLMFPDDVWMGNFRDCLEKQQKPWPFRRVWVFDVREKQVKVRCSGDEPPI
jgi:hypothetical protein|tara:strand:+ start:421 stop:639 length:219 start_codon:yes stop_codon:yes gene_type:complete